MINDARTFYSLHRDTGAPEQVADGLLDVDLGRRARPLPPEASGRGKRWLSRLKV